VVEAALSGGVAGQTGGAASHRGLNDAETKVLHVLARVPDPEIPVLSVVDLGAARRVRMWASPRRTPDARPRR